MLLRQTFLYLPAQILGPFSQMAAAFIWTHFLEPADLGAYALIWGVQEFVSLGALYWWSSWVLRYANTLDADGRGALDRMEMAVQLCLIPGQALAALGAIWIVFGTMPTLSLAMATVFFTLTRNVSVHFADRARAQFEPLAYTILQASQSTFGLIFGIAAVIFIRPDADALLWSYTAAQALGLLIALPMMRMRYVVPQLSRDLLRRALAYGLPLLIASLLVWTASHGLRFIVQFMEGPVAVGLVSVGWWLGMRLTMFASLLVAVAAFPIAVERVRNEGAAGAAQQMADNGALLLGLLAPSVAGLILFAGPITDMLIAEPYREVTRAVLPFAIVAGAMRNFKNHATDQCFMLFERTQLNILSTAVEASLTIVFCVIGLHWYGLTGAVAGCAAAAVLAGAFSFGLARWTFGYFLRWSDILRIGIATAAMAMALLVLVTPASIAGLAAEIAAGAIVYLGVAASLYPAQSRGFAGALMRRASARSA